MANNLPLSLLSLDPDTLKANFIAYLRGQTQFKDYDYAASNMSVMLSLLSYNTFLNGFYLNMVASEAYLDSAQLLDSVVSKAKLVNYLPNSYVSPVAYVNISIVSNQTYNQFVIPKGTQFSGDNANGSFTYVTQAPYALSSTGSSFSFANVAIYEGSYVNETFVIDNPNGNTNQIFTLSNPNVDVESITVLSYENNGATVLPYIFTPNFFGVNSISQVYYLQAGRGSYQVVFGDDVFGRTPQNGATVLVSYRITQGDAGNGIGTFSIDTDLGAINGGTVSASVVTQSNSTGGSLPQSIDSVRFSTPRYYEAQDRAVTTNDYQVLILDQFPDIKAVAAYSGSNNVPSYGITYLSPLTQAGTFLSNNRKNDVISFIQGKMTLGFTPVMVDPQIVSIVFDVAAVYNSTATNFDNTDIETIIINTLEAYSNTALENFNSTFSTSQVLTRLQTSDQSINTVDAIVTMYSTLTPTLGYAQTLGLTFQNPILPGTLQSTEFQLSDGYAYSFVDYNPLNDTFMIQPDQSAVANKSNIVYMKQQATPVVYKNVGTVDYSTGTISIQTVKVLSFLNSPGIVVTVQPAELDINGSQNIILEIDVQSSNVTAKGTTKHVVF